MGAALDPTTDLPTQRWLSLTPCSAARRPRVETGGRVASAGRVGPAASCFAPVASAPWQSSISAVKFPKKGPANAVGQLAGLGALTVR